MSCNKLLLDYLGTLSVCVLPADRIFASIIKCVSAVLRQLVRMDEVSFGNAHMHDLRRETRHQRISLTTVTVDLEHLLQALFGDLDQFNILIAPELRHLVFNMTGHAMNMVGGHPRPTSVQFPEANLIKIDTCQTWMTVLLSPG